MLGYPVFAIEHMRDPAGGTLDAIDRIRKGNTNMIRINSNLYAFVLTQTDKIRAVARVIVETGRDVESGEATLIATVTQVLMEQLDTDNMGASRWTHVGVLTSTGNDSIDDVSECMVVEAMLKACSDVAERELHEIRQSALAERRGARS